MIHSRLDGVTLTHDMNIRTNSTF